jgi:hypothetical protein
LLGFLFWTFSETTIGIFREHLFLITEGDPMQTIFTNLRSSVLISFLTVLPFMIMEWVNRQSFRASGKESFPFPLFGILWLDAMLFLLIGMASLRSVRNVLAGKKIEVNAVFLLIGVVFLVGTAWAWGVWIIDQWPCFIGVPNCD